MRLISLAQNGIKPIIANITINGNQYSNIINNIPQMQYPSGLELPINSSKNIE